MKSYHYVVKSGGTNVAIWGGSSVANQPVISSPSFTKRINGGLGNMAITLPLPIGYSASDIALMNTVETYVEREDGTRKLIHSGTIEAINRSYDISGETITVDVYPWVKQLSEDYLRDGTSQSDPVSKTWSSAAASTIMKDILDLYLSNAGSRGKIHYTTGSIPVTTAAEISIEVGSQTYLEAISEIFPLGPQDYFWYVDVDGLFRYAPFRSGTTHRLTLGKDIASMRHTLSIVDIANTAYFWNANDADGTAIALELPDVASVSQTLYGRRVMMVSDSRIDNTTTAKRITDTRINNSQNPLNEIEISVIADSFNPGRGYPIEDFEPGQKVVIANSAYHKNTEYVITDVDYSPEIASLTLSDRPTSVAKSLALELLDLERNENNKRIANLVNLPTA